MQKRVLWGLAIAIVLSCLISPSRRDLLVGDEAKYARIVHEMRESSSLMLLPLEGRLYADKPPLHFWALYATTSVLGERSVWAYVIPSLLFFALLIGVTARFARELFGGEAAAVAGLITGSFVVIWGGAQTARMDVMYAFFITAAVFLVYRYTRGASPRTLYLAGVATGLAIMVKGPMSFIMVAAVAGFDALRHRRWVRGPWFRAAIIAIGISLAWLVPALALGGRDFAQDILIKQNVGRAVNAWVHDEPLWFYFLRSPVTFMPWFFAGVAAIGATFRRNDAEDRDGMKFCVDWILAVVVPFSILSSKLDVYMVPAMPAAAILLAGFVRAEVDDGWSRFAIIGNRAFALIFGIVLILAVTLLPTLVGTRIETDALGDPVVRTIVVAAGLVAIASSIVSIFLQKKLLGSTVALAIGVIAPLALLSLFLMPRLSWNSSARPLVEALERQRVAGEQIALYYAPYLWTRTMRPDFDHVSYIGRDALTKAKGELPLVVSTRLSRAEDLAGLAANYTKVDEVNVRGRPYGIYRRR